jgi:dUTP pyrophosphatase
VRAGYHRFSLQKENRPSIPRVEQQTFLCPKACFGLPAGFSLVLFQKKNMLKVKIVNKSKHPLPSYATVGSAGMDLRANLDAPLTLQPLERALIPTGLYVQLPKGYEGQIRARSGLSIKKGITLINGVGTLDSDYTGEIKLGVVNLSNEPYTIADGERLAQLVVARYEQVEWEPVETLTATERGEGGFGSTGIK